MRPSADERIRGVLEMLTTMGTRGIPAETLALGLLKVTIRLAKKGGITREEFLEEAAASWAQVQE